MYVCYSDSFGEEPVDLEVGKKENRTGDTDETTMAEFLKVWSCYDEQQCKINNTFV